MPGSTGFQLQRGNGSCCIGISAPKDQITEATIKKYTLCMKKYGQPDKQRIRVTDCIAVKICCETKKTEKDI